MTQKTRTTPHWTPFHNESLAFAKRVVDSVDTDLQSLRRPPDDTQQEPDTRAIRITAEDRARNAQLLHAFGHRWQHHNQHHDTKGGVVNVLLLRTWRESALHQSHIEEVAVSTRHEPIMHPQYPSMN